MNQQLRDLFKNRRVERQMSHEELATNSLCTAIEIRGFERGLFAIGVDQLYSIVQVLRISPEELYSVLSDEALKSMSSDAKLFGSAKKA